MDGNSFDADFDYLSGTVSVPANVPESWRHDDLDVFFERPNDKKWGQHLCRILFHETIHFWQILSCSYHAKRVEEDYERYKAYNFLSKFVPESKLCKEYYETKENAPFSARELTECVARFWDLHTRGPALLMEDEGIDTQNPEELRTIDPMTGYQAYTNKGFDFFMQRGRDQTSYERPYRWMLDKTAGHSALVVNSFPILMHVAFAHPDPVAVFVDTFDFIINSGQWCNIIEKRSGNINYDWIVLCAQADSIVAPRLNLKRLEQLPSGFDTIIDGGLKSHPVYRLYGPRIKILKDLVFKFRVKYRRGAPPPGGEAHYMYALASLAMHDGAAIFAQLGQPEFRLMLGISFPPPRIRFKNFTYVSDQTAVDDNERSREEWCEEIQIFSDTVRKFRNAESAMLMGLPPNAFETPRAG